MQMTQVENPNIFEVQKAYAAFYDDHAFEKNSYTQYFKHWMHWARPFVQPDGSIKEPGLEELAEKEKALLALRSNPLQRRSDWTFLGP